MLVSLFALVTFSFMTFFLPVVTGMDEQYRFCYRRPHYRRHCLEDRSSDTCMAYPMPPSARHSPLVSRPFGLVILCTVLYFLNWIPPIPLSLKFGGIYHQIEKNHEEYLLTYEKGPWYAIWKQSNNRMGSEYFGLLLLVGLCTRHASKQPSIIIGNGAPSMNLISFMTTDRIPSHDYRRS